MTTTQFDNIYHGLTPDIGKIRVAASGIAWKVLEGDRQVQIAAADIKRAEWFRVARKWRLRIHLNPRRDRADGDRRRETFDGFTRENFDKLSTLFSQLFSIVLETKDISFKGWNWGATDFQGDDLAFLVSNKTVFELPLSAVSNSNIAGKTEVSLEFATPEITDRKKVKPIDELVEIRFYVPGTVTKAASSDDEEGAKEGKKTKTKKKSSEDGEGSQKEAGSNAEESEEEGEELSAAQQFHTLIRERATISSSSAGALLVTFDDIFVATPRGRYDIDMYQTSLRLRGKTYDYKIQYTTITRLYLLPKDDQHVQFVVGLERPIHQGLTRYSYLVMQFARDQEMEAEINMEEEALKEKYEGKLEKSYDQPAFQVVSSVFRALSGKKIIGQTRDDASGIKCNLKANPGEMHLLEKSIVFVGKQPVIIDLTDVHQVVYTRLGNAMKTAKTFDFTIETKSGTEYTFNAVNRDEHEPMDSYLKNKKVRISNRMTDDIMGDDGVDDDDEEMQSVVSSGDEEPTVRRGADVDEEDSEEDADFQASSSDGGSPSESDSEGSDSGGGSDEETTKKKKSKGKRSDKTKEKEKVKEKSKPAEKSKPKPKSREDGDAIDSPPKKKKKSATGEKGKEVENGKERDKDKDKDKAKEKPKAKPKPKPKSKEVDAMEVDETPSTSKPTAERPRPKPKPKPKVKASEDGPVKKKQKKDSDD